MKIIDFQTICNSIDYVLEIVQWRWTCQIAWCWYVNSSQYSGPEFWKKKRSIFLDIAIQRAWISQECDEYFFFDADANLLDAGIKFLESCHSHFNLNWFSEARDITIKLAGAEISLQYDWIFFNRCYLRNM